MSDLEGKAPEGKAPESKVLRLIPGGGRKRKERVKRSDGATCDELLCLSELTLAIAVATYEGLECDHALPYVAERLRALAGVDEELLTEFFE
jgi:hypothetical protein